jgi:hypothetical protein
VVKAGKVVFVLVLCSVALGSRGAIAQTIQGGFRIAVLGTASPANPSVTIRVSGWWEPHPSYLWYNTGSFDFESDPGGVFSDPVILPVYTRQIPSPFSRPGVLQGNLVTDVYLSQAFDLHTGLVAVRDNPLPLWEVTWTTQDFAPRLVHIGTTGREGATFATSGPPPIPALEYVPGSAFIRVVPAPAVTVPLSGLVYIALRRRRARNSA